MSDSAKKNRLDQHRYKMNQVCILGQSHFDEEDIYRELTSITYEQSRRIISEIEEIEKSEESVLNWA